MAAEQLAGDVAEYCRKLESYLCQKNEGHLVRIVGPAFEQVCSWAERGVPLRIAFRGIDRYCERHYAKPGRRRPVRIEFCEADILDAFDEWRRAVGVGIGPGATDGDAGSSGRKPSLASHIERVMARLRTLIMKGAGPPAFLSLLDSTMREIESFSDDARGARGDSRARIIDRMASLDRQLMAQAADGLDHVRVEELRREAEAELATFAARLTSEARQNATAAAFERLVREACGLPTLSYE